MHSCVFIACEPSRIRLLGCPIEAISQSSIHLHMCFTGPTECFKELNQLPKIYRFHIKIHILWQLACPSTLGPHYGNMQPKFSGPYFFWWGRDSPQTTPLFIISIHSSHCSRNFSLCLCCCFSYTGELFLQTLSFFDRLNNWFLFFTPSWICPFIMFSSWVECTSSHLDY